ncbi:hypothetical protein HGRIS_014843 [Hohenbuehelia grisea]|uniref:Uncharacterized protein n=1 Tax=Hohenbuehelia grisea TaxID=104357 RepID=A0ABR3IQW8_9AGAR
MDITVDVPTDIVALHEHHLDLHILLDRAQELLETSGYISEDEDEIEDEHGHLARKNTCTSSECPICETSNLTDIEDSKEDAKAEEPDVPLTDGAASTGLDSLTGAERRKARKKIHDRQRRREKRKENQERAGTAARAAAQAYKGRAIITHTSLGLRTFSHSASAWLGRRVEHGSKAYSLDDLITLGMRVLPWDGRTPHMLVDKSRRVFAVLPGRPKSSDWDSVCADVVQRMESAKEQYQLTAEQLSNRRGPFVALATGILFDGGQTRPGNRYHTRANREVMQNLTAAWSTQCVLGFGDSATWVYASQLASYYYETLNSLTQDALYLRRNRENGIYASTTYNFGPNTVCLPHIDFANLAWGWCVITALGCFDPDRGGHIVLWDLGIVIRFPPGSTIIIPSALLKHSNASIVQGEKSITQYSAGGLFRWVANGHRTDIDFKRYATEAERDKLEADQARRWDSGLEMLDRLPGADALGT